LKNYVSASVLSADMLELNDEIKKLESSRIDMLHFDVMDGIFVNNITFGLPILKQVRSASDMFLDVHLMIVDPYRYISAFADAGADMISFHIESKSDTLKTINAIKERGIKASLALRPATSEEEIYEFLPYLDMVLVMTVEPGFGGQSFMPETVHKIRNIRQRITEMGLDVDIEVDGGINGETVSVVREAGANVFVSGSYLFGAENMMTAAEMLRKEL
jgi:ribulose-phosphate 3-epimerase